MKTLGSLTQAELSRWNLQTQWSSASINQPSFITPPPGTNPLPLACGPSSYGTSSSGALRGEPDDAEDHRSTRCGSAGRRHRRSAGRSYRRTTTWCSSDHQRSPIPLPPSVPPCEQYRRSTPGWRGWVKSEIGRKCYRWRRTMSDNKMRTGKVQSSCERSEKHSSTR